MFVSIRLIPKKKVIYGLHFDHFDAILFETLGRAMTIALSLYQLTVDFDFEKCLTKYY